jgi:hypothetical protein
MDLRLTRKARGKILGTSAVKASLVIVAIASLTFFVVLPRIISEKGKLTAGESALFSYEKASSSQHALIN